mmetsp:Transcript_36932/g.104211  ORF Transcript_36932/g.104211 Transcript_36932/m.104211 type:complete len:422 (-) Transcript_36932:405-1670(-)
MSGADEMCELERQRLELIERNKARMKELNLGFMMLSGTFRGAKSKTAGHAKSSVRKPVGAAGPSRQSSRRLSRCGPSTASAAQENPQLDPALPDDEWLVDDEDTETEDEDGYQGSGKKRRRPHEKTFTGEREFVLPPAYDEHGNILPRRKSCHVCTQCIASWRGNFSMPLACTTCPLIFCSRCLFHINGADDIEEAHDFIEEHQGQWSCFVCTETCACQDAELISRGLARIDRHKARGWVGVTGGNACVVKRPSLRRRKAASAATSAACCGDDGASNIASPGSSESTQTAPQAASPVSPRASQPSTQGMPAAKEEEEEKEAHAGEPVSADGTSSEGSNHSRAAGCRQSVRGQRKKAQLTGRGMIGKRVKAWWAAEEKWFEGKISKYDSSTNQHTITYDDGDHEHIILPDDSIVFLKTACLQ